VAAVGRRIKKGKGLGLVSVRLALGPVEPAPAERRKIRTTTKVRSNVEAVTLKVKSSLYNPNPQVKLEPYTVILKVK
jgi:hypothetical protein